MILSATDLLTITEKPNIKHVSLQTIQEFYNEHLCGKTYIFEVDDEDIKEIKLQFLQRHLPHLLGIHYILRHHRYSGQSGYDLIENGSVTFDFLKKADKQWFGSKKNRMLYFPFLYQLLQNPTGIKFSNKKLGTSLDVEIILYNQVKKAYLHLGVSKYKDNDFYFPKSFYERNNTDHIDNQVSLTITNKQIV